jgi:hypothetical protein
VLGALQRLLRLLPSLQRIESAGEPDQGGVAVRIFAKCTGPKGTWIVFHNCHYVKTSWARWRRTLGPVFPKLDPGRLPV